MRSVGLKILKDKLSEYVRMAASGETVLVTDRDRVVAELGPPDKGRAVETVEAKLAQIVREGLATLPSVPPGAPPRQPAMTYVDLAADLDAARQDR
jgi:antitoxin (DNA-binding transcriptional repressor) of toxin-antitoxin stability system